MQFSVTNLNFFNIAKVTDFLPENGDLIPLLSSFYVVLNWQKIAKRQNWLFALFIKGSFRQNVLKINDAPTITSHYQYTVA